MSRLTLALCLIFAALSASLQLPACCTAASRLPASRVAGVARTAVCMCDAPAEEAAAAPVEAAAEEAPKKAKKAKVPIEELEVGQELTGKIRSVMSYGAEIWSRMNE